MNDQQSLNLNELAEKHIKAAHWNEALPLLQQVFLTFGKDNAPQVRAQVARALYGAALCHREMGNAAMCEQIEATLVRRFGNDSDSKVRYWVELAQSGKTQFEEPFAPELPVKPPEQPPSSTKPPQPREAPLPKTVGGIRLIGGNGKGANGHGTEALERELEQIGRASAGSSSASTKLISENDVSLEGLKQIFDNAFIENELQVDSLLVVPDSGLKIFLRLNEDLKLIRFAALFGLRKFADIEQKLAFVNRVNDKVVLVRFSVSDDEMTLYTDFYLPYIQGVLPFHIVHVVRLMNRILEFALKEHDMEDLLS